MEPITERAVRSQIERICDSNAFRAAPKLAKLLRFLADKTLEGGDLPLGQHLVAQHVIGDSGRSNSGAGVVIRMQVGRLRRHLDDYYAALGSDDPIRVEVPKRNYRLRLSPRGSVSQRAAERATLAVVEFGEAGGVEGGRLPGIIARELAVALGPYRQVAVLGPVPEATIRRQGEFDFELHGDVRREGLATRLTLRLLCGRSGLQAWTKHLSLRLTGDTALARDVLAALNAVADELADETGVIAREGMRASASRRPESLSAHGAVLAFWRFLMTGGSDDLLRAREVSKVLAGAVPDSPALLCTEAMTQLALYLSDPRSRVRCPREPLTLMERAASLAPGDPWVHVYLGFARWISREPLGLEAICRNLDGMPGSGSFRGMLGSLMVVAAIDLARGEELLQESLARAPQPLYWFCHHAALAAFRRGDLQAMQAALDRIAVRSDPFSLVLRMVAAARSGDPDESIRLSRTVLEVCPSFPDSGEEMMRRLLHDDHVDAVAAILARLGLGWFA